MTNLDAFYLNQRNEFLAIGLGNSANKIINFLYRNSISHLDLACSIFHIDEYIRNSGFRIPPMTVTLPIIPPLTTNLDEIANKYISFVFVIIDLTDDSVTESINLINNKLDSNETEFLPYAKIIRLGILVLPENTDYKENQDFYHKINNIRPLFSSVYICFDNEYSHQKVYNLTTNIMDVIYVKAYCSYTFRDLYLMFNNQGGIILHEKASSEGEYRILNALETAYKGIKELASDKKPAFIYLNYIYAEKHGLLMTDIKTIDHFFNKSKDKDLSILWSEKEEKNPETEICIHLIAGGYKKDEEIIKNILTLL